MTVPHLSISTLIPVNNRHVRQYEMFCQTIQLNYYMADKSKENNKLLLCRSLKNLIHSECTWHLFTNGSWRLQNEPLLNDATERTSTRTRRDTSSMNILTVNDQNAQNEEKQRLLVDKLRHLPLKEFSRSMDLSQPMKDFASSIVAKATATYDVPKRNNGERKLYWTNQGAALKCTLTPDKDRKQGGRARGSLGWRSFIGGKQPN